VSEKNFEYFNEPGRPYTDDRIELYCGDLRQARRVRWDDLDDLLSRILEMGGAWGGEKEREAWTSWAHSVVLAATAQRALIHRPDGFSRLDDAPDGTQWMLKINPFEEDDDER